MRSRSADSRSLWTALAGAGAVCCVVGLVVAAFGAWVVWGSDYTGARNRQQAVQAFEQANPGPAWQQEAPADRRRYDEPPTASRHHGHGEVFAVMTVPSWDGMRIPLAEGVTPDVIDMAYGGHFPDSSPLGAVGNAAFAAHRRSYGSNFRQIDRLAPGDPVVVDAGDVWVVYSVVSSEVVRPQDYAVTWPVPHVQGAAPTRRLMTMTTCHSLTLGELGNDHRYAVLLEMSYWLYKSDGTPAELGLTGSS